MPSPTNIRRLNRDEYAATIRDLLDIQIDVTSSLPADGAGGEGFDNAGETLFLSPLLSEKYMQAAKFAMDVAAKEYKSRERILVARPGNGVSPEQAAREILKAFLPRAFRRPATDDDIAQYLTLFRAARKQGQEFEPAIFFTLRASLVSPRFLFLAEPPNNSGDVRPLDAYSLASRMSYFLLGSMPDELLFDIAAAGKLHNPAVVHELIPRMLRREQALEFAKRFVDQWLRVRQLDTDKAPDAKLFPAWTTDEEMRSDIRLQPAIFFQEILKRDLSILNLIDSSQTDTYTQAGAASGRDRQVHERRAAAPVDRLAAGIDPWRPAGNAGDSGRLLLPVSHQPGAARRLDSGIDSGYAAASSARRRSGAGKAGVRRGQRLFARCSRSTAPIPSAPAATAGSTRWASRSRTTILSAGGETRRPGSRSTIAANCRTAPVVAGPQSLKAALLERKDLFVRNLTAKMLGYALGRGLTQQDSCTVDRIVAELRDNDYRAQKLIELIVLSGPFQNQPPAAVKPKGRQQAEIKH